jgi:hypothetical protein
MVNITVEISLPYGTLFKYSGPAEQLEQVKELFSKWIGRASSVCFSNSKRQVLTSSTNPGSSQKKRQRRPRKGKLQGGKKPGMPAGKQPKNKQPPLAKACKCTECGADFNSHTARKKHFNINHKPDGMEVEQPMSSRKKAKRKATIFDKVASITGRDTETSRHFLTVTTNNIDDGLVCELVGHEEKGSGNYRILPPCGTTIDINNYNHKNGTYGLTIRGYKTTLKPSEGMINGLLRDGLNPSISDTDYYDRYKSILLII